MPGPGPVETIRRLKQCVADVQVLVFTSYVEDCQVCCQPIEMELRVDDEGKFVELVTRRGDA